MEQHGPHLFHLRLQLQLIKPSLLIAIAYKWRSKSKKGKQLLPLETPVGLLVQLRFEASARTSSAFCLVVIELDVGAMDPGRSFVAVKQNGEGCAAGLVAGERDHCSSSNSNLWAARGAQFV